LPANKHERKASLSDIYRYILTSRLLDEKMMNLLRQGKSYFHIGAAGHEAAQVGAALAFEPGHDWCYPYYRDQAFVLTWGATITDLLLLFLGRAHDPSSGGRQMPQHYGHQALRIVSQSSPTGTQYLQAVGTAIACKKSGGNNVVYVSSGEGATSQGDFYEAVNWATRDALPVIFFIQDNNYAISVPRSQQTTGDSVYELVMGYRNLHRHRINGLDAVETKKVVRHCVQRARNGEGPSLVVANTVRLASHSSSDDQRKYRSKAELEAEKKLDPLALLSQQLVENKERTKAELEQLELEVKLEIDRAAEEAENSDRPDPKHVHEHLFALRNEKAKPSFQIAMNKQPVVMVDALNHALQEEMAANEKIVLYGEDVQDPKGGVFTVTKGLSSKFGQERVFNSPLAESSIVGTAIGMALAGFLPVIEIQFGDYIWTAMMQIRNEVATMRWRSNGKFSCPMVIRVAVGGYIHGALCHSQNIEGFFAHLPGLYIAYPANAADAKGLLKQALRLSDPVLFLEHKGLYRQSYAMQPEPESDYYLPFGQAAVVREGKSLTIVTYGMMVHKAVAVNDKLAKEGYELDVIDLRTIYPVDWERIMASIARTGKVLVLHEDTLTAGFGAELCAELANRAFEYLDAPVRRLAARDLPVPYSPELESAVLPQEAEIEQAVRELIRY
jgi:2-oxoisovalerate dehydrogenase E1 component